MKTGLAVTILSVLLFFTIVAGTFICVSKNPTAKHLIDQDAIEYKMVEVDGCEYIMSRNPYTMDATLTHKGNCRYCQERLAETLKSLK